VFFAVFAADAGCMEVAEFRGLVCVVGGRRRILGQCESKSFLLIKRAVVCPNYLEKLDSAYSSAKEKKRTQIVEFQALRVTVQ
jgi:hypothetical protein